MKNILLTGVCLFLSVFQLVADDSTYRLLVGTYTNTKVSEGIYSYAIDVEKGVFRPIQVAKELVNPVFWHLQQIKSMCMPSVNPVQKVKQEHLLLMWKAVLSGF